jgi:hypothetical protein
MKTIAKAKTIEELEEKAKAYFFRAVRIVEPLVYNGNGTGLFDGVMVEKKGGNFNLIKL